MYKLYFFLQKYQTSSPNFENSHKFYISFANNFFVTYDKEDRTGTLAMLEWYVAVDPITYEKFTYMTLGMGRLINLSTDDILRSENVFDI